VLPRANAAPAKIKRHTTRHLIPRRQKRQRRMTFRPLPIWASPVSNPPTGRSWPRPCPPLAPTLSILSVLVPYAEACLRMMPSLRRREACLLSRATYRHCLRFPDAPACRLPLLPRLTPHSTAPPLCPGRRSCPGPPPWGIALTAFRPLPSLTQTPEAQLGAASNLGEKIPEGFLSRPL
jgi:hypothetical protein